MTIDPKQLARRDHPLTSHQAAHEILTDGTIGRMMEIALDFVQRYPDRTAAELEQLSGYTDGKLRKRLTDLRRADPPRVQVSGEKVCSVTGRTAQTWRAVAQNEQQQAGTGRATTEPPAGLLFRDDPVPERLNAQRL